MQNLHNAILALKTEVNAVMNDDAGQYGTRREFAAVAQSVDNLEKVLNLAERQVGSVLAQRAATAQTSASGFSEPE